MNLKALLKPMTVLCVSIALIGVYAAKALPPPIHHSWLPEIARKSLFLRSHANGPNPEIGRKGTAPPRSNESISTIGPGAALLREPRQGTVLSFTLGEEDSSIGESSWLFLLGTCLLGSAAALFHKMRA